MTEMEWLYCVIGIYFLIMSIVAVAITVHDKRAAKKHRRRVPERVLMLTAAASGCIAMYITMRAIHHKTRHLKFMLGIPVIFVLECAAVIGILFLTGVLQVH